MIPACVVRSLDAVGSTRQIGLMRIGLAWLTWAGFGFPFILHFDLHPDRVALALSFYVASWLVFLGVFTRVVTVWLALTLVVALWQLGEADAATIWSKQHRQLTAVAVALFAFAPAERSFSVDRWWALARARTAARPAPGEHGPLWALCMIRGLTGVVFGLTALWQVRSGWLSGMHIETVFFGGKSGAVSALVGTAAWSSVLAWALFLAHAFVSAGLWFRRTRASAVMVGAGTYLLLYAMTPSDTLALLVIWMLFAFVPGETVHRVIDRLHGR